MTHRILVFYGSYRSDRMGIGWRISSSRAFAPAATMSS